LEVVLPSLSFLREESFANVQGISSLPQARLERRLGRLPDTALREVRAAISFALELQ